MVTKLLFFLSAIYFFAIHMLAYTNQGPLKQMDGIATRCKFANEHYVGYPWHLKKKGYSVNKFESYELQIIKINRKKFDGSDITPSYFPALMKTVIFGHFTKYRARQQPCFSLWNFYGVATI